MFCHYRFFRTTKGEGSYDVLQKHKLMWHTLFNKCILLLKCVILPIFSSLLLQAHVGWAPKSTTFDMSDFLKAISFLFRSLKTLIWIPYPQKYTVEASYKVFHHVFVDHFNIWRCQMWLQYITDSLACFSLAMPQQARLHNKHSRVSVISI